MINNKKVCVTIEARMTSNRLPGKVLLPMAGEPSLKRMLDRVKASKYIDEIVVATTTNADDDPIVKLCEEQNVKYFRGSEQDVLLRVLDAAKSVNADLIVELTGDCPLIDYRHIEQVIEEFEAEDYDYASNTNGLDKPYPDGFNVQVFPLSVLAEVDTLTNDPIDRVHVSYYIYNHLERFKMKSVEPEGKMAWHDLEISLDEESDYILLDTIFKRLLPKDPLFSAEDIIDLLKNEPELLAVNAHVERKAPEEG